MAEPAVDLRFHNHGIGGRDLPAGSRRSKRRAPSRPKERDHRAGTALIAGDVIEGDVHPVSLPVPIADHNAASDKPSVIHSVEALREVVGVWLEQGGTRYWRAMRHVSRPTPWIDNCAPRTQHY